VCSARVAGAASRCARRFTVRAADSLSGQDYTPFVGRELAGRVTATFLRRALRRAARGGPARGRYLYASASAPTASPT